MDYFDLKLTQKVSRLDLVRRLRSKAQLQFCTKSAIKYKKKQDEINDRHKWQVFHQLAGIEARLSAETHKSPQMTDLTKFLFTPLPKKQSVAQTTYTISTSDD